MDPGTHAADGPDRAQVAVRPPLLVLGCLAAGGVLHALHPVGFVPSTLAAPLGMALVAASIALFVHAVRTLLGAGESLPTNEPTRGIVRAGPYRFSRNPIYLSFCALQLGVAVWVDGVALLATAALCFFVLNRFVIDREEAYLARKFGTTYLDYTAAVRRWL